MSTLSIAVCSLASSLLLSRYHPLAFPFLTTFIVLYGALLFARQTYAIVLYPHFFSPLRHFPSPPGGGFFSGHFLEIFNSQTGVPHIGYMRNVPNRGLIRYRGFLNQERLLPTSPEMLKEVLHTQSYTFIKPSLIREGIGRVFGTTGLLFVEGEEHRHQRKLLTPAFSYGQIKALVPTFWERSVQLQGKIGQVVAATGEEGGEEAVVEMATWLSLATLDIIGAAGFGYECGALASAPIVGGKAASGSELGQAYNILFSQGSDVSRILGLLALIFPRPLLSLLPLKRNREVKEATSVIHRVTREIVEERKAEVAEKPSDLGEGKDILTTMLRSGHYSAEADSSIRDQLLTFLAAGHETTATALTWALYRLSLPQHKHIQERLRAEIYSHFPGSLPETVSHDEIESLKYLRNFTMEILRLHPPVGVTRRIAAHDTTLGGEFVPQGTDIILSVLAINRSIELWGEDADEFNPDRWEKPVGNNYSLLTFLSGPRGCIGSSFAKVEFKCLLVALLGAFEFEEAEGFKGRELVIKGNITQKPVGGIPVCVRKVKWGGSDL